MKILQSDRHRDEEDHTHYHGVDRAEEHLSVSDALQKFLSEIVPVRSEIVKLQDGLNRILFSSVRSEVNIPSRGRSTRDGYALRIPAGEDNIRSGSRFKIVGETRIGEIPTLVVRKNEAVRTPTGGFIPFGANCLVMKEYTKEGGNALTVLRDVAKNENILQIGEDIRKGSSLLRAGTRIRPHNIALLALAGKRQVRVYEKPKIAFFSTGDELIDIDSAISKTKMTKTNDVTRPFVQSMVFELGAIPVDLGIARDDYATIRKMIARGLSYDGLILSAGSSVGERDYATQAVSSIKKAKILVHGVAMRPSSPTGLGIYKRKPIIMLPGFPTSAIVSFFVFARPAILKLSGDSVASPSFVKARLEHDYSVKQGLTHFLRLKITEKDGEYYASVVKPTEAQYSSWLKDANGIGVLNPLKTNLNTGDTVDAFFI